MSSKIIKTIIQTLLLFVIIIIPFIKINSLYFPYVSGKAYFFRFILIFALFFWIWLISKEKKYKPNFKNILVIALILFFLAQILTSFLGVDPILSFFSTFERGEGVLQYGFWLLYFLMLISIFKRQGDWKILFYSFIIVAVLISSYSWLNYSVQIRLSGIFGNPSYLAVFLLFAIGFSFIVLEKKFYKSVLSKYFIFLAIIFFIITLIATQTRGAYLGLLGGIFLFCFLSFFFLRKDNKKLSQYCGIILLLGIVSITSLFLAKETDFVQNTYILKRTVSVANLWNDDVVKERLLTWQIALKAFQDKPIFGWGIENFGSAFNKHYDYRIGVAEPWFDRAHNQPFEILANGGIILFFSYVFWLLAVIYLIFKLAKEKKALSFLMASIFLAYFLQGLFLFDVLPTFLGLFPFLGFLFFECNKNKDLFRENKKNNYLSKDSNFYFLIIVFLISLFAINYFFLIPYKANASALNFYKYIRVNKYQESKVFLEQSFNIKSPYTFWETRKRSAWSFAHSLEDNLDSKNLKSLEEIYDYIVPELEKFIENKPYDPQAYYVLGKIYYFGFEKLNKDELLKIENIFKKSLNYSNSRLEYIKELIRVLILQDKKEEVKEIIEKYIEDLSFNDYVSYLIVGHFYFVIEDYNQAMDYYEKAKNLGYQFYEKESDYINYMLTAEELEKYQEIIDMTLLYLERWGPKADTFFNLAVGYLNLQEKEKAKDYFYKALELDSVYQEYEVFFGNL